MRSAIRPIAALAVVACTAPGMVRETIAQRPEADVCSVPPGAQPLLPAKMLDGMGRTAMPVTTKSGEARAFFNQGMAQVHSFWFQEAERSFVQAAALDANFAMAHWGISVAASGDYRPAFQHLRDPFDGGRGPLTPPFTGTQEIRRTSNGAAVDPRVRAREAIAKAMSLLDGTSERERLYIQAEAARRNTAATSPDADHIAALRKLVAAYPDDLEAKSMLGLALLDGYDPVTKAPRKNTVEGLTLLHEVIAKDDQHFGAHHYLIHGWEGSTTPEQAWHSSRRYPELVPNIPHALHMPGHIYAQSDKIDEAIAAFAAASDNELKWLGNDTLYPNGHHGHNVHFLIHSLNLDGRFKDSMDRARHLLSFRETPRERSGSSQRTVYRQGYYSLVKTLVRFQQWDQILDPAVIPVYDKPEQQAWRAWAIGLAYAAQGKLEEARSTHEQLTAHVKAATASRRPLAIAAMELDATLSVRSGDRVRGYGLFRTAADMEAALIYTEPPSYPRPVVEGLAVTAAAVGDHATAENAWRETLAREPGSGRAYFGLAAALRALNRTDEGERMAARGTKAWDKADVSR
jgi:tetratricopeptide (TPR) repeat protein